MYCTGPFCKYLVCDMPTIDKNASSVPGLINGKRHVSLGQLEEQLKKLVGVFPITSCLNVMHKDMQPKSAVKFNDGYVVNEKKNIHKFIGLQMELNITTNFIFCCYIYHNLISI